jgi:hypothetical protein
MYKASSRLAESQTLAIVLCTGKTHGEVSLHGDSIVEKK